MSYTTSTHATLTLNTESTYDWEHENWSVPINFVAAQLFKVGKLPIQLGVGPRIYAASPMGGASWGLRLQLDALVAEVNACDVLACSS